MSTPLMLSTLLFLAGTATLAGMLLLLTSLFFFHLLYCPEKSRPLPSGPIPWPIIGSLPSMLLNEPHFRWALAVSAGNDISSIRLGGVHLIIVNTPELACEFLKKHDATFASRPLTMSAGYSGRGYLTAGLAPWGDQWKKMRRVVTSKVVNNVRLRSQTRLRLEEADHLVRYIYNQWKEEEVGGRVTVDIRLVVRYFFSSVMKRMMFSRRNFGEGGKYGGPGKEDVEHVEAVFTVLSLLYAFCPSDYMPCLRFLDLGGHEKTIKKAIAVINKYHDPIIDERLERWRGGEKEEVEDVLDLMISLKDRDGKPLLTAEEIKAQTAELIDASIDNPSNIVEWAIAHMLDQPEILVKAMEELDRVVGKDRLVQEPNLSQLFFIKACARETLRLHPVVPFNLPHVSMSDTTVAGYFIPKGSWVVLSRVGLGKNPKVWNDPLLFNPGRHWKNGSTNVDLAEPELRFISFTAGRRGCMGSVLGSLMTHMCLARLLQAFEWSIPPGN